MSIYNVNYLIRKLSVSLIKIIMRRFFDTKRTSGIVMASLMSFLLVVLFAQAATTISTNINTAGTLTVSDVSTLTGAVTMSAAATVGTNFTVDTNTFYVDGTNNKVGVLTLTPNTALEVVGTASSTGLVVGGDSTNGTITGIVAGDCDIAAMTITASSTKTATCSAAGGVRVGDKVFVSATSTPKDSIWVRIGAASSTVAGQIGVEMVNLATSTTQNFGPTSLFFWAVR